MGTITGLEIIRKAARDLLDPDYRRWSLSDWLGYLNAGQREIAILRPDASVSMRAIKLQKDNTFQSLPPDGLRLIDIVFNLGEDGATPGRPVTLVEREELDALDPTWHSAVAAATQIDHYTYDGRSPRNFYVYPKPSIDIFVHSHVSVCPADVLVNGVDGGESNTAITLEDIYETPLYDYMRMRAHSKDTDGQDLQKAAMAEQSFYRRLGLKIQVDRSADPNRNAPPRDTKRGGEDVRPAF